MRVTYKDHMGSDLTVVNAARVSFDKESTWALLYTAFADQPRTVGVLSQADESLIKFLARGLSSQDWAKLQEQLVNCQTPEEAEQLILRIQRMAQHWTPFAHPQITMLEEVPIFVARQRFKHTIGFVYNEVSRRYVDDRPEFYCPDAWRSRPQNGIKQGSGDALDGAVLTVDGVQGTPEQWHEDNCQWGRDIYESMIEAGIAPEQARMELPQSMMTSYWVTGSLAAWARAYNQRIDPHAQKETQELAKQWGEIIAPLFPVSWRCLTGTP